MKYIWTYLQKKNWSLAKKHHLFLCLTTLLSSALGFILWFALHFFVCNKISWAICFTGYPGFFLGFIGGILYLYRHGHSFPL